MKLPARLLLPLWFLCSALFFAGADAHALSPMYKKAVTREVMSLVREHPRYLLGSINPARGLDCSGFVYLVFRRAGVPGITRTVSYRMSLGLGGWTGRETDSLSAEDCDLLFWTFTPRSPHGHVGTLVTVRGMPKAAHASSTRGVVLDDVKGWAVEKLTKIRRISIGDAK